MTGEAKDQLRNATQAAAAEAKGEYPAPPVTGSNYNAPGRLGDPKMELKDEPRANAKLLETASQIGLDRNAPPPSLAKLNENSSLDEIASLISEFDAGLGALYNGVPVDLPEDKDMDLEVKEETIKGGDGQDLKLYIYRPKGQSGPLPGIVYTHGGGMVIVPTMNPIHDGWCRSIAHQGTVVILVDFRNAWTKEGYHHFPVGLNDCTAAIKWIHENRQSLNISNIVLQGESGGGNLACAIALTANREGWVKNIDGVFATVPYISNAYGWSEERKLKELPSLVENNGFFLNCHTTAFLAHFYTPTDEHQTNPLAWPYYATVEDMKGLPPHIVAMDELDPLRDEGISYARRLAKAGVDAKYQVNLGVVHGSSLLFRKSLPEYHRAAVRELTSFAKSL